MNKCKFAGDTADSVCATCDGLTIQIGLEKLESYECEFFEPETEVTDFETETELPWNKDEEEVTTEITYLLHDGTGEVFAKPKGIPVSEIDKDLREGCDIVEEKHYINYIKYGNHLGKQDTDKNTSNLNDNKLTNINTLEIQETSEKPENKPVTGYISQAVVSKISYSSGITVEKGGVYYKINTTEEWTLPEGCDVDKERKLLWEKVNSETDKQINDIMKG